jgi:hypothetical protein
MNDDTKGVGKFVFTTTMAYGLAILVLLAIGLVGYYVVYPAILEREAEAARNSPQYIQSAQDQLSAALAHYDKLQADIDLYSQNPANAKLVNDLHNQQAADVCEVRAAVEKLNVDAHPDRISTRVRNFLRDTQGVVCQ